MGVPPGIGLSLFIQVDDPNLTFKSRYILLNDEDNALLQQRDHSPRLELLTHTSIGHLYLNLDAECATEN
jgi:hypothetical protein